MHDASSGHRRIRGAWPSRASCDRNSTAETGFVGRAMQQRGRKHGPASRGVASADASPGASREAAGSDASDSASLRRHLRSLALRQSGDR